MRDMPPEARPREKLLARGPQALADAELLALLLRTGLRGQPVLQFAQALLAQHGGLRGLLQATPAQLARTKGLGPAKRAELLAVFELARRALAEGLRQRPVLDSPSAVADVLRLQLADRGHEVFAVLFLDNQHRLIALEELFRGTLDQTSVYPREVALRALHHGAAAVILAHNHPSGAAEPSAADVALTQRLRQALGLLDIRVLDHLVVTQGGCTSMAQRGLV
ncbi:MAG: RadC family protein [Tepidimonas ignava]|uniref:DNA replication and repair protein RadC n=1 Tax=Tepidimonas ignava TaxID=114249 RepID=A0A4R3L8V7_9BURK|nr:DNA repair protein RadC [Tepidimonas ignava]TCS96233.1 DNA replication and repair protein RadC [Tepidimonas ignava]TSE23578.1 radc: DNA repair protein RadC [Tepidimonas ignava]